MRNRELRSLLEQYPDDLEVLIPGYEAGWDPLSAVAEQTLAHRTETEPDWIGRWFDPDHPPAEITASPATSWAPPIAPPTIDRTEPVITLGAHTVAH